MHNCMIIGIGGISGGGKTSITCEMENTLKSVVVIHMDDYYQLTVPIPQYDSFYNWDCLESIDWDRMISDIETHSQSSPPSSVILVEGTMILNYSRLQKYFSQRHFITLPHNKALERRRLTFSGREPEDYFDSFVWPAFVKCYTELLGHSDVDFLDGSATIDENCNKILRQFQSMH